MAAYVMAVDSPYFAISDESRAFVIAAVLPANSYSYHAWHSGASELSGAFSPGRDRTLRIEWGPLP
jgi:hypothetical protein